MKKIGLCFLMLSLCACGGYRSSTEKERALERLIDAEAYKVLIAHGLCPNEGKKYYRESACYKDKKATYFDTGHALDQPKSEQGASLKIYTVGDQVSRKVMFEIINKTLSAYADSGINISLIIVAFRGTQESLMGLGLMQAFIREKPFLRVDIEEQE